MSMRFNFLIFNLFLLILLCVSCNIKDEKSLVLHQLSRTDYSDELMVEGTVEAVRIVSITCPPQIQGTITYLIEDGTIVKPDDVICILENRELTNQYEQLLQQVEQAQAEYTKSEANLQLQYSLLEAQVKNNEAQSSINSLDSAQLKYASPVQQKISNIEMQISAIEKAKIEKKLKFLKTINESELKRQKLRIVRNTNRAENINNQLKTLTIKTTQGGLALRSYAPLRGAKLAEGDLVWYGISLVTIPDMTEMKVTILASESDYKRIDVNNKVNYTFSSMPGNKAFGKILKKAPMGIPINRNSKVKRFEITASVDSFDVIPEPGLSAKCQVTLKEIPDTIVVPQLAIFEEDSAKYVYIHQNRKFDKQEIILGQYSPKLAVVVAGLNGNEQVSFVKPPSSKISKTIDLPDSIKKIYSSPNSGKAVENPIINKQTENTLIKTQRVKN